ncbi:hypothetical protein AB4125_07540 [Vibrio splendidus]
MAYLDNIKIDNHDIFGSVNVELTRRSNDIDGNYFSLIIGENGTGKSELLKTISNAINYRINNHIYKTNLTNPESVTINFRDEVIPDYLLVSALSLNDKFQNVNRRSKLYHPNYRYMGIRSTTNNAFIGKYKRDFLDCFIKILSDDRRINSLKDALFSIGLPYKFKFSFEKGRGMNKIFTLIEESDSVENFTDNFNILISEIQEKKKNYRLDDDYLDKIKGSRRLQLEAYNFIKVNNRDISSLTYEIDLLETALNEKFIVDFNTLQLMMETKLISIKDFHFTNENEHSFSSSSSGQYHILSSFINIISNINDNSILLIDEPEISLHATWQIKYFDILKQLLHPFKSCHTIICSHSHFLVSAMEKQDSSVIHIKNESHGKVSFNTIEADVWGWSPENVLYNVFGVSSTRNSYFEQDLRKIISIISKENGTVHDLIDPLERIKRFNITNEDPLSLVIERAEKFINEA